MPHTLILVVNWFGNKMKLNEIAEQNIEQLLNEMGIENYEITPRGVDVEGDVKIPREWTSIPFQFNFVSAGFYCVRANITSLQGAPREVGGNFYCQYTNITSLQGAPREVGGNFH